MLSLPPTNTLPSPAAAANAGRRRPSAGCRVAGTPAVAAGSWTRRWQRRHRPTATAVVETSCNSSLAAWRGWSVPCCGVMTDSLRRMAPAVGGPGEAVSGAEVSGVESGVGWGLGPSGRWRWGLRDSRRSYMLRPRRGRREAESVRTFSPAWLFPAHSDSPAPIHAGTSRCACSTRQTSTWVSRSK